MGDIGAMLQEWRVKVRECRKCRMLSEGIAINPLDLRQLRQARIHYQPEEKVGCRRGWALAMLDKSPEPEYHSDLLAKSCRSGIVAVLEAPNFKDTYQSDKGYMTYDRETDETGKFTRRLFGQIGVAVNDIVFTNSVQCLPARKGKRYQVSKQQIVDCHEHLLSLLGIVRPKAVLAFGTNALKALHRSEPISLNGRPLALAEVSVGGLIGKMIPNWARTTLVPLFHPSPIVHANARKRDGTRGTGRSKEEQLVDITIVLNLL